MVLKGNAKIELTNADGTKEIIEHKNMITNAVSDLCLAQRGDMASILKITNNGDSFAQALFGGLLLFDDTLNTDANDYTMPTAKITGYASQDSYAGLDVARGSFNASEGGVQEDGSYKFVWDFSTSQANGTIKSLALCPNVMGKIGASDTIVASEMASFYFTRSQTEPFNTNGYMLLSNGSTEGTANYNFCIVAIDGDIAYAVDTDNVFYNSNYPNKYFRNNGNILKLHKFKMGTNNISLGDNVGQARYLGCNDVQLPTDFIDSLYASTGYFPFSYFFDASTKKLVVFPCYFKANIVPNGTTKYIDIDLLNMTTTTYTFTNTTQGTLFQNSSCNSFVRGTDARYYLFVCEKYIMFVTGETLNGEKKIYVCNRSDNTRISELKDKNGNPLSLGTTVFIRPVFVFSDMAIIQFVSQSTGNYVLGTYIVDMKTGLSKKTNMKEMTSFANVDFGNKSIYVKTGNYLTYVNTVNPFILTTKNNLDSPVTKTSSQTMKITYTLSEKE